MNHPPFLRLGHIAAPVRSHTVSNLRDAILTGRFRPGERLVEADLCRLLGVSRPLRQRQRGCNRSGGKSAGDSCHSAAPRRSPPGERVER